MYFRVYASQLHHVKDVKTLPECDSQSSNNNIQNIPKNDISDSAYPIKTNVNFTKINDNIVYINPTKNTFLPVAFPAQLITTTSHVCLIQHT